MIGNGKLKNSFLFKNNIWPTGRYLMHFDGKIFRGKEENN